MKIKEFQIKNFRLLKDVTLSLDEQTTVIVGRNNSGKTSLTELTRRLLADKAPNFRLEDFSLVVHDDFWQAFKTFSEGAEESLIREMLPTISVLLRVKYDTTAPTLGALSEFVIDVDASSDVALISISYQVADGRIPSLFENLNFVEAEKAAFYKAMKDRIPGLFRTQLSAIDPTDNTNIKLLDWSKLQACLKSGFVNAQRGLYDDTYHEKDVLGKILEGLFNSADAEEAAEIDKELAEELKKAADSLQSNIETGFSDNLAKFIPAFELFGYPGLADPGLGTETTIDVARLLKDHTRIKYQGSGSVSLPESFNGLGTRNLIYILFKLFEFFKSFQALRGEPGIHLIFIEEPEAHLHPQMQEVFIKQLSHIQKVFTETYNEGNPWPVQFVVSTHSSHIANAAPFDSTRYFITSPISAAIPFRHTRIKDLSTGLAGTPVAVREFLHKYMTLTRCDLLFADKAILVEGATERIILPTMIQKNDVGRALSSCLNSQYVTVMEVGGAYAHNFLGLLEFLEIRTLIITDIDSTKAVTKDTKTTYDKCLTSEGTHTSNATINHWFGITGGAGGGITSTTLIAKSVADKTKNSIYITYQLPETPADPCGRSFEGTFMLANPTTFDLKETSLAGREQEAWDQSAKAKKTEFALKYSIEETIWNVPKYIKEGLDWLVSPIVLAGAVAASPAATAPSARVVKAKRTVKAPKS